MVFENISIYFAPKLIVKNSKLIRLHMAQNLLIVESPAKAKTIEGYLGSNFVVKSSFGHVRDLKSKGLGIDVTNNFKPDYAISTDKKTIIADLKKLVKKVETVWLATDEDREGEAISWHLYETLNLDQKDTKRVTFNEITKIAVQNAIKNPRKINQELVNAQQARRILDRIVGFELSPVLWKKVKPSLSAGRVQSVAVRLIVEREREIEQFQNESFFKVNGLFKNKHGLIKAYFEQNLGNYTEAKDFLNSCCDAEFFVSDVSTKPAEKKPSSPFTTSTLQQEASLKLGFSVSRTMSVAQTLYEAGHITYMRTDSVNFSDTAIENAKNAIFNSYGKGYSNPTKYTNKNSNAQEAHEAIRPSDFSVKSVKLSSDADRLYDLIWKRSIASQMSPAKLERTTIKINAKNVDGSFISKGEVIKFDGFLKVYLESSMDDEDEEVLENEILPIVHANEILAVEHIRTTERFTKSPARYMEASLVKKLEELGIGRPSTYAPTISTIQKRGYVEKNNQEGIERPFKVIEFKENEITEFINTEITGKEKNKLIPTDIGMVVNDFLVENFSKILDYSFTAEIENEFDEIAQGLKEWTKVIHNFYNPFHENVENTLETANRASGERVVGNHPTNGKKVIVRLGKYGPIAQIGESDDDDVQFSSLRNNQSIGTITLTEVLELFKLPRTLGQFENKIVKSNIGRFGPYIQHDKTFVSIKEDDPISINLERAIELILEKREEDSKKIIKTFEEDSTTFILNGRWGPYLKIGKNNFKLPKDSSPEKLTYAECILISQNQPKKQGKRKKK